MATQVSDSDTTFEFPLAPRTAVIDARVDPVRIDATKAIEERHPWKDGLDWTVVVWMTLVHVLALAAPFFFTWKALGLAVVMSWMCGGLGICLCFHRMLDARQLSNLSASEMVARVDRHIFRRRLRRSLGSPIIASIMPIATSRAIRIRRTTARGGATCSGSRPISARIGRRI